MNKSKLFFKILLYGAIPFVLYYLIQFDYLQFNAIEFNTIWLMLSVILLWLGFIFSTISWKYALKFHSIKINTKTAIVSHGLSVFAKYIPGKIWVILGRAAYVAEKKYKVSDLSYISLKEQLLYILIGLLISFIPTILSFNQGFWPWLILATILGLSLILFYQPIHDFSERILNWIFKKAFTLPYLSFNLAFKLCGIILIYWILWTSAFYFFLLSVSPDTSTMQAIAFPLSVCYGVLALIMPGGLGVRESIMAAFLIATGVDNQLAITISVISRLWFMSGEVFLFTLATVLNSRKRNKSLI